MPLSLKIIAGYGKITFQSINKLPLCYTCLSLLPDGATTGSEFIVPGPGPSMPSERSDAHI